MAAAAIKQGVYDILTKPFTTDELYLVVRQGLERRRLALEVKRLQAIEVEVQRLAQEKARLEELDKAKVAFNRLVTHELQAPVSAVLSYLDLMLKNYIPPEKQREYLERAASRVKGLMALIGDSIEFSRLKDGRTTSKPEFIQMESILSQVIAQYENQAAEKKVTIHANISTGIAPICMIEDQARSIWTNLISNGIKYTPEGGRILIILRQAEASLIGQVIDTGIGIPEDAKGRLFMEFFRAGNAKSLNIPGSGLGLAIVKQIIDKAGGNIWVESTMGKGSTFSFSLPITNS
jgi:signal transduction histidine kinase